MGHLRRHFVLLLGATVVVCLGIVGLRWWQLEQRVPLTGSRLPAVSTAQAGEHQAAEVSAAAKQASADPAQPATRLININHADTAELMNLPGIGEVLARRIVEFRTEHGPFSSVAELGEVHGIGEKKLAGLDDLVTIGGSR